MHAAARSRLLLLGLLLAAGAGWLLTASGNGSSRIIYETDVPGWRWTGGSFRDQYVALLLDETDLRRARAALPDPVWRQAGQQMEEWLAAGDTAVVVAYLGEASTGGYAIRIVRVEVQEARDKKESRPVVTVTVARRRPGPDEFVTQAFTYPYDAVPVATDQLPDEPFDVRFVDPDGQPLDGDGRPAFLRRR